MAGGQGFGFLCGPQGALRLQACEPEMWLYLAAKTFPPCRYSGTMEELRAPWPGMKEEGVPKIAQLYQESAPLGVCPEDEQKGGDRAVGLEQVEQTRQRREPGELCQQLQDGRREAHRGGNGLGVQRPLLRAMAGIAIALPSTRGPDRPARRWPKRCRRSISTLAARWPAAPSTGATRRR